METAILRPVLQRVKVDVMNRVVIPRHLANELQIKHGDCMEVFTTGNGDVIYRKAE